MLKLIFLILIFLQIGLGLTSCNYIKSYVSEMDKKSSVVIAKNSEIELIASATNFKFSPEQIIALPGQSLKLKITNQLKDLPIVFSILKKDEDPVVNAFLGVQAGESLQWSPPDEHILVKTKLLGYNESESIQIVLPKEPGDYAFISSYPGQVDDLQGLIKIKAEDVVVSEDF